VVGKVTEYQRLYAGLYSQMAVGASIAVWDTRTGKRIWSDEHVTRQREGGIPLLPEMALFPMGGVLRGFTSSTFFKHASSYTLVQPCSSKKFRCQLFSRARLYWINLLEFRKWFWNYEPGLYRLS
jgi:hypothetical protein